MDNNLLEIIGVGLIAVLVGSLMIMAMVYLELGPVARINRHKQKLLVVALGSGILAFILKIIIIVTISRFPQYTIHTNTSIEPIQTSNQNGQNSYNLRSEKYRWIALSTGKESAVTAQEVSNTYQWQALPEEIPVAHNELITPEQIALGRKLFTDPKLSRDGTVSCSSCHDVFGLAGADARPTSIGIEQQRGDRNAPTVWNTAFQSFFFWDGRATSLEQQAKGPLLNPKEMGMPSYAAVEEVVRQQEDYQALFNTAFGDDTAITIDRIAVAIAAYERSLITPDTPYDRLVRGDINALSPAQLRGMALFETIGCVSCHYGPNFSSASIFDDSSPRRIFPANPIPQEQKYDLLVKYEKGGSQQRGVWRVPSLRNVALTGPWLHNGAVDELDEVVRIMAAAQLGRTGHYLVWSHQQSSFKEYNHAALSDQEVSDIVAFLHTLSSDRLVKAIQNKQNKVTLSHQAGHR